MPLLAADLSPLREKGTALLEARATTKERGRRLVPKWLSLAHPSSCFLLRLLIITLLLLLLIQFLHPHVKTNTLAVSLRFGGRMVLGMSYRLTAFRALA